jgi:release factor H-coupled RctB family protein
MGTSLSVDGCAPIHNFTSSKSWIEGNATLQLETLAKLADVTAVAAMPDLHPGKYGPVGCAILAKYIHPALVGADIGCGMGLFQLDVAPRRLRADHVAERMRALGGEWDGDVSERILTAGLASTPFDHSLGTIGGGNHFSEVQIIDEIIDVDAAKAASLDADRAYVLAHSGSRGFGFSILERVLADGIAALEPTDTAGAAYLSAHDHAVGWAVLNRRVIAERTATALRADIRLINDVAHNFAEATPHGVLHRKGAAASDRGLVPVPGSRGALSYLVQPLGALRPETLASIAHGAGRKYERGSMHGRVGRKKSDIERLERNRFGGVVVCEDRQLLIEEAPEAYKSIEQVIDDLVHFELAKVVATFRPLVTFKSVRDGRDERRNKVRHRSASTGSKWEDQR